MPKMLCLSCDRTFNSISATPQCGVCGSRDIVSYSLLNEIAHEVSRYINYPEVGIMPYLEVVAAVLKRTGIRLRPVSTLRLCTKIHEILQQTWKKDMQKDLSVSTDRDRAL